MIYIVVALYPEAQPFIAHLKLRKDVSLTKFQVFKGKDISLIITGVGDINAAVATTYLLCQLPPCQNSLIINVGIAGGKKDRVNEGDACLCNKLYRDSTQQSYYPDILFSHSFREESVTTLPTVCKNLERINTTLVDMEAAAVYQSAINFVASHQIAV